MFFGIGTVKNFNQCLVQWVLTGYGRKLRMCEVSCQQYGIPGESACLFTFDPIHLVSSSENQLIPQTFRNLKPKFFFQDLFLCGSYLSISVATGIKLKPEFVKT